MALWPNIHGRIIKPKKKKKITKSLTRVCQSKVFDIVRNSRDHPKLLLDTVQEILIIA